MPHENFTEGILDKDVSKLCSVVWENHVCALLFDDTNRAMLVMQGRNQWKRGSGGLLPEKFFGPRPLER